MTIQHHRLAAGDVDLHCVAAGDGPPVVLLHGFPETWYQWRAVIDAGVPGTAFFDEVRVSPRVWHTGFHNQRDLAEARVSGREQVCLDHFIRTRLFDPGKITAEELAAAIRALAARKPRSITAQS